MEGTVTGSSTAEALSETVREKEQVDRDCDEDEADAEPSFSGRGRRGAVAAPIEEREGQKDGRKRGEDQCWQRRSSRMKRSGHVVEFRPPRISTPIRSPREGVAWSEAPRSILFLIETVRYPFVTFLKHPFRCVQERVFRWV